MQVRRLFRKGVQKSFQFYWRQTRALTLGAQGMVLDSGNRLLLVRHTYRPGWHMPGGGVEKGETIEEALIRELAEEVGIELTARPHLFGIYANFRAFPSDHIALFVVRHWRQTCVPAPNHEIAGQCFAARAALPDGTIPAVGRRWDEVLGDKPPAADW
jgi:8-oxo-dGTP pyrophosphatase MutT (NUDIX family)